MKTLPAVMTLRTIWEQQFEPLGQGGQWRVNLELPAAVEHTSTKTPFSREFDEDYT